MTEAGPMTETATTTKKKKSLFGMLKKSKKKDTSGRKESRNGEVDMAEHDAAMAAKSVAKDGTPVITAYNAHQFHPSDVRDEDVPPTSSSWGGDSPTAVASGAPPMTPDRSVRSNRSSRSNRSNGTGGSPYTPDRSKSSRRGTRQTIVLDRPPTAKESAFSGPPKYDWVDVETAAAVKVQSVFRRNRVMSDIEARGGSTSAIRNRSRARARAANKGKAFHSDDAPDLLACCGVGFLFGDATEEDQAVLAEERRKEYQDTKRQQELEEAEKRKYRYRKKASDHMNEQFEVLDS